MGVIDDVVPPDADLPSGGVTKLPDTAPSYDALRRSLKWEGEPEFVPQRHHDGDAGFDLVCAERAVIQPGEFRDIDCGIRVEMPAGVWGLLTGRSSTLRRRGLLVAQGIIDNGYRGPLFAGVHNLKQEVVIVEQGERLAQLIPLPLEAATMIPARVDAGPGRRCQFTESDRGEAGFGSTGE